MPKKNSETESNNVSKKPRKTRSPKKQENVVNPAEPPRSKSQESNDVVTQIETVELTLVKTAEPDRVVLGDVITYTVVATNTGTVPINNATFRDEIPEGTSFVEGSFSIGGVTVEGANPEEGVNLGTINPGQRVTVTFRVTVDSIPCPPKLVNSATVSFSYIIGNITITDIATSNIVVTNINANIFKQISVDETVCIPCQKPEAEEILDVKANVVIVNTHLIKTPVATSHEGQKLTGWKLAVEGMLVQTVLYIADEPCQSIHAAEFNVPFSTYLVLPIGYTPPQPIQVTGHIEDIYFKQFDGRCIFKNITLMIEGKYKC